MAGQRLSAVRTGPLLAAALNGDRVHPALPRTAAELAAAAREAVRAGARVLHLHPYDDEGRQTLAAQPCAVTLRAVRAACPGTPISLSTSAAIEPDPGRRRALVAAWTQLPELVTANQGEDGILDLCELLITRGVGIEAGLLCLANAHAFIASGLAPRCVRAMVEPLDCEPADAVAHAAAIEGALVAAGVRLQQVHHGEGIASWAVNRRAVARGHGIRTGLEDTPVLPDGRVAAGNGELVAAAAALLAAGRGGGWSRSELVLDAPRQGRVPAMADKRATRVDPITMPRSLMNAVLRFGEVAIPVKLHSATASRDVRFHEVHVTDGSRIEHRRFCAKEDTEVPYEQIAKGYEVSEGKYAVLTKEQLSAATPPGDHRIDVEGFVPEADIDRRHYDSPYYLGAGDGGADGYRVLHDALHQTGRAGIARFVFHDRERLAALRVYGDILILHTLHFADELVDAGDLRPDEEGRAPTDREAKMARQLIASLHESFQPTDYEDEHRAQVLELIERKAAGEPITAPPAEATDAPEDLAASLQASLDQARHAGRRRSAHRPPSKQAGRRGATKGH